MHDNPTASTAVLTETITNAKTLWASALPDVPAPPDATFRLWLGENEYRMFEGALAYAPRRVERLHRNGRFTPLAVYKYVSTFLHQVKLQTQKPIEMTLLDAVNKLTPDETKDPSNVIRILNIFVLDELIRYQKQNFFRFISDTTLRNIRFLQESTDIKTARNLAARIVDSFEVQLGIDADGSALRRLAQIERAVEVKSQQTSTGGVNEQ